MRANKVDLLSSVPLFEGLSKKELRTVVKEAEEEVFNPGRDIVAEGKSGGRFYLIVSGRAKVSQGGRGRATLGPGDFFGEMSILDKGPRSATVTADSRVEALSIASWNFLALMQENFSIARKVMQHLSERIREKERSLTH
jgi:CRP/FNR family cyclic AMP-dependent transcriptional regulator